MDISQWLYMAPPNHPMVIKWQKLDEQKQGESMVFQPEE